MTALARSTTGERMLAEAESVADLVGVLRFAEAARTYARQANLGPYEIDAASRLAAKALLRMAEAVNAGQETGEIRTQGKHGNTNAVRVSDLGVLDPHLKAGRDLLAAFGTAQMIDDYRSTGEGGLVDGRAELVKQARAIMTGLDPEQGDDWYTPRWMFDQIGLMFDLDVCAPTDPAARSCPAARYYTETDDGLTAPWHGLVWCNPPYSDPGPWADRMGRHGNGILLAPFSHKARWTLEALRAASSVRWIGWARFIRPNGTEASPNFSLMLATFGDHLADALTDVADPMVGPLWKAAAS